VAGDVQVGVQRQELLPGAVDLGAADVGRGVEDLALEVRDVDDVEIDEPERADPCGGEVERQRRAEASCADAEHLRRLEPLLPVHRHFGHDQVARKPLDLGGREGRRGRAVAEEVEHRRIHRWCGKDAGRRRAAPSSVRLRWQLKWGRIGGVSLPGEGTPHPPFGHPLPGGEG
jgi:hypothetical protein